MYNKYFQFSQFRKIKYFRSLTLFCPRTMDTRWLNTQFFAAQIQIQIQNKYLEFALKGLVFCRNKGWVTEIRKTWTHSTKMGADWLGKNTPNAPKNFSLICPPKPESLRFKKYSLWVSVVHGITHSESKIIRFKFLWTQTKQVNIYNKV